MVLNERAEKSVCVPSCEKWWCHHVASWVVRIASATPIGSESTASRPMRCATRAGSAEADAARRVVRASGSPVRSTTAPATGRAAETCVRAFGRVDMAVPAAVRFGAAGPLVASEKVVGGIDSRSVQFDDPVPDIPHRPRCRGTPE
jgi:hypothetical protein